MELGSKGVKLDDPVVLVAIMEMHTLDTDNSQWLKKIVGQHGWPGRTLVGSTGAHAAWLLIQHADQHLQKTCLDLMVQAPAGEVEPADIAYLTDRVRLAEGKPQRYGTQVELKDGRWQANNVENPAKLDDAENRSDCRRWKPICGRSGTCTESPAPPASPSKDGKQSDHNKTPASQAPP